MALTDHTLRRQLSNELHARPFPILNAPSQVAYLALTPTAKDKKHLQNLIKVLGGKTEPQDGHYYERFGNLSLKWERHTEFVTYTILFENEEDTLFSNVAWDVFPKDWLDQQTGQILAKCKLIASAPKTKSATEKSALIDYRDHFCAESLAVSYVLDANAVIISDFHLDVDGFVRFVLMPIGQTGSNRLGRITQRLLEIETYRAMSMLTLPVAKNIFVRLGKLDQNLVDVVKSIANRTGTHRENLDALMSISSEIEFLNAEHAYRFGAGEAYGTLVDQRIKVLREERFLGLQTFSEFMMRRFNPTVRTCQAAQVRLQDISDRAARAVDLLGTRVSVRAAEQNHEVLAQMDRRSEMQLRLQETVEGFSVVAISYYAVNLISYFLYPFAKMLGLDKPALTAITVAPVVVLVFLFVRRMKRSLETKTKS